MQPSATAITRPLPRSFGVVIARPPWETPSCAWGSLGCIARGALGCASGACGPLSLISGYVPAYGLTFCAPEPVGNGGVLKSVPDPSLVMSHCAIAAWN